MVADGRFILIDRSPQVNFLALDFDLTILDIHTSGRWPGTPEQLTQRIRPFFQALIPIAIDKGDTASGRIVLVFLWRCLVENYGYKFAYLGLLRNAPRGFPQV